MHDANYIKNMMVKFLSFVNKKVKPNYQLQQLFNQENYYESLSLLQEYNLVQSDSCLACGLSSYFNEQIEKFGIANLKLAKQDIEDARYIASCFGKEINFSDSELSTLYVTLLGTTEFNYAMQGFPAGIFEDVFQCPADHSFPIQPIFGESEADFYCRILEDKIMHCEQFRLENKNEVLHRAKRLADNFCQGKNRVYVIPLTDVLENKASFGDVDGLRDGRARGGELEKILNEIPTLEQLLSTYYIQLDNLYSDPNMTSEFGVAIYGTIKSKNISYIEVARKFDLIQQKAEKLGYSNGETIPTELELFNQEQKSGMSK